MIKASDIRQFLFCPRIFYFYNFTDIRPVYPAYVGEGNRFHDKQSSLFNKRNFAKFHIKFNEVYQNLYLNDDKIYGVADLIFVCDDEIIALEFKNQKNLNLNRGTKMQLIAYSLLASKRFKKPFYRVILCCENNLKFKIYQISGVDLAKFDETLSQMQNLLENEIFPDSSASPAMCANCEFKNFCDDRE